MGAGKERFEQMLRQQASRSMVQIHAPLLVSQAVISL